MRWRCVLDNILGSNGRPFRAISTSPDNKNSRSATATRPTTNRVGHLPHPLSQATEVADVGGAVGQVTDWLDTEIEPQHLHGHDADHDGCCGGDAFEFQAGGQPGGDGVGHQRHRSHQRRGELQQGCGDEEAGGESGGVEVDLHRPPPAVVVAGGTVEEVVDHPRQVRDRRDRRPRLPRW